MEELEELRARLKPETVDTSVKLLGPAQQPVVRYPTRGVIHHWGWNKTTGKKIICNCPRNTEVRRSDHFAYCEVWTTKEIYTFVDPQTNRSIAVADRPVTPELASQRRFVPVGMSLAYPCITHTDTNCRVRSSDHATYCKNCLTVIGLANPVSDPDRHLGASRAE